MADLFRVGGRRRNPLAFLRPRPPVKRAPDAALRHLNRTIVDLAHPFAAWLSEAIPDAGGYDPLPEIVAASEAEFARSVGGQACPRSHGVETEIGEIASLWPAFVTFPVPCPECGAVL